MGPSNGHAVTSRNGGAAEVRPVTRRNGDAAYWRNRYEQIRRKYVEASRELRERRARPDAVVIEQERVRAIGELAFGIAHDANNILAALRLRIGILMADRACREAQKQNLESIDRILAEGCSLVSKLHRIGRGKQEETLRPVSLEETIRGAVEIAQSGLRVRAAETGVEIRIRCEMDQLPPIRGSMEELRHVFVNLLLNARDAMAEGGTITVRARREGLHVLVRVEDEGPGISPSHLPRIFDAFFTTKGSKGTGLGLAMARAVMERLGGRITAQNRPEGGASFELRFPTWLEPERRRKRAVRAVNLS